MVCFSTKYMGMEISSPLVLGASDLSLSPNIVMDAMDNGIGAVVYPTLFEEVAMMNQFSESQQRKYEIKQHAKRNMFPFVRHGDLHAHLSNVRDLVKRLNVPVIGSLNCLHPDAWVTYAKALEDQGVKGIELNFCVPNFSWSYNSKHTELEQCRIVELLKSNLHIPVAAKLSPYFTNLLHHVKLLDRAGVDSLVLFGNPIFPDINTQTEQMSFDVDVTSDSILHRSFPFIGKLYSNIIAELIGSGGVRNGYDIVKMILAGAESVQVVSTVYRHKVEYIPRMLEELKGWMASKGYDRLEDFRGNLSIECRESKRIFSRKGYVDMMIHSTNVAKKYPLKKMTEKLTL
ncbi:hypothetical protein K4L44_08030 [Halosquirtibacter laminarini]|uniref:Uncharacterized protein n=1 Tax=Halosquirtibacter laminarini TaxID=3374600 RepID=A0AC61NPR5_9BACT|nr:hypothetical protein K4L44_08030 [Prolixibacteraceae bacterium]